MTDAQWEREQKKAFAHLTVEQMERELRALDEKRNPSHADYSRMDALRNALYDAEEV